MKRVYLVSALTCALVLALSMLWFHYLSPADALDHVTVGFIYDSDESTPYTYNFSLARDALAKQYGNGIDILTHSNVQDGEVENPLRGLVQQGCNIIFLSGYSTQVVEVAKEYPQVQFCQVSYADLSGKDVPSNYHSFKGEIYQGRYASGVAAGMKLKQLIGDGALREGQALVGFVAAYPTPEVISGYTAFLLGVRSEVPQAVMHVRYTYTWSSYSLEKSAAQALIDEGCVIISQHSDTIGPAIACEETAEDTTRAPVYHVGYNQSMAYAAPSTELIATRINWEPYITAAVAAVIENRPIESEVDGTAHGTDMSAGFDKGWVEVMDLNPRIAAEGTAEALASVIDRFSRSSGDFVFRCEYAGVNPSNPNDTCDLKNGYLENRDSSYPSFHYLLEDIITIDN